MKQKSKCERPNETTRGNKPWTKINLKATKENIQCQ